MAQRSAHLPDIFKWPQVNQWDESIRARLPRLEVFMHSGGDFGCEDVVEATHARTPTLAPAVLNAAH
jgi:hypothetical protein